jgi:hypothetical protein
MRKKGYYYEVKTRGMAYRFQMLFDPACSCGNIEDGVGFRDHAGWWVIPFRELEEMYKQAKRVRDSARTPP